MTISLYFLAISDIKVFGNSETLLDYEVAHIGKMSAFADPNISTQAGNSRPVCLYSSPLSNI
jgi:hypothetical protein